MGILSRLGMRGKALTGTPGVLEVLDRRQFSPYIQLGGAQAGKRIDAAYARYQAASYGWIYAYQPAVRQVINYIASNAAELSPKVFKRISDDERKHVGDHPAAQALRWPNGWTPGQHFIFDLFADFLTYDNAYALKFPVPGGGLTLVSIPPPLVGVVGRSFYQPEGYEIQDQNGEKLSVPVERMLHWRGKGAMDPRLGESKLETLREELASDAANRQATTELARSGLAMPGVIERPVDAAEWTEEARQRFQRGFSAQAKKATREVPVIEEGMTFKALGITPEDAEVLAARRFTLERVAGQYGMRNVPPENEEQRRQFYVDVLKPLCELCAAFLDLHILVAEYGLTDHYFQFNLDEKLMSDDRIKTLISAAGGPIFTRDEARAMVDQPPLPNGEGKEIITPGNVTVGGKPSVGVMPIQNPNGPPQDGSHRSGEAEKPMAAGSRASLNGSQNGHHKAAPLIPRRNRASKRRDRWAQEYQGVLDPYFDRQRRSLKSKKAQAKAITDDRWNTELANGLNDVAMRQFEAEGAHVAFRLAFTFDPDQGENWLAAKSIGAATAINATTAQHAEEADLDKAFSQALVRSAGAAMAYATDIAAFSTKVAAEQAPGEPTVTIDGGSCDVCAPYQGSSPASEVEAWPSYHTGCDCVVDVQAGAQKSLDPAFVEQTKSLQILAQAVANGQQDEGVRLLAKAIAEQKPPNFVLQVAEGAFNTPVEVHPPPPAVTNVTTPDITVNPAQVNFAEGAFAAPNVNVEAAKPADISFKEGAFAISTPVHVDAPAINVEAAHVPDIHFEKGALHVENTVEAPAPADTDINFADGAFQVEVNPGDVNVEAPEVNVEVKGGKTHRTVKFSDGHTAEIDTKNESTKTIRFSDGRTAEINEEDS